MTDEKKPHPLALGGKRPEPSKKGRPRKEGARTKSGRLKAPQLVIDRRKAMCDDVTKATSPLDVAHYNGWLDEAEYRAGLDYARLHRAAGFGVRGGGGGGGGASRMEIENPMDLSLDVTTDAKSFFSGLPHAEVAAIWDSVFNDDGRAKETAGERAAKATLAWKAANAALTIQQRHEVRLVCIEDSFPQWILQRRTGRMGTSWEAKRTLLIDGLRAIRRAIKPARPGANTAQAVPAPRPGQKVVDRTVYVDQDTGAQVLEVERIMRRRGS